METSSSASGKFSFKNVIQYFFQGIIVIAPIAITLYVVIWMFNLVDNFLPDILYTIFPKWMTAPDGSLRTIPGLGFLLVVIVVTVIGWLSSSFIVSKILSLLDTLLEQTPGIKYIYTSVKDFLEAFAGNKKKFDKPVLVNVDAADVWRVGFITHEDAHNFNLINHAVVYVPHAYAVSGITYIVPKEKIKPLTGINSAEVMKFVISGGVTQFEEQQATLPV